MVASRSTSRVLPREIGRAKPVGSLQAQKMGSHSRAASIRCAVATGVSGKHPERGAHPLSSEVPRDIPATRPTAMSNQVTSASVRQGPLRPPSDTGPSTTQNTNQRRDVVRPLPPITQGPQRVGNMLTKPNDEKPRVGGGARRVLIPTTLPPETEDTEIMRTLKPGLPSVKPIPVGSAAGSLISKRDPKKNPVPTKTHSAALTSASTIRPRSQTGAYPVTKVDHPPLRATASRVGQPQSRDPPKGIEVQTSSQTARKKVVASAPANQQAMGQKKPVWGGRSVTKGAKPAVKALTIRSKLDEMKSSGTSKPAQPEDVPLPPSPTICPTAVPLPSSPVCSSHQSCRFELPVQAATHDSQAMRCIDATPSREVNIQESPSKTPITALLSSIQRGFLLTPSSPLSPPQTYLNEVITHTYLPNSPTGHKEIAC